MNIPSNLQNYLCELVENKKQKNADFANLNEYKKYFMGEQKSSGDSFGGGFGQGMKQKESKPEDSTDFLKIGLGDTDWKLPAAAYAGGALVGSGGEFLLNQLGGNVARFFPKSFGEKALKSLGLGAIDVFKNLTGQARSISGFDWANEYFNRTGFGTNRAYASSMGADPATGRYVPGVRQFDQIKPSPSRKDIESEELRQRVRDAELRRKASRLGIS